MIKNYLTIALRNIRHYKGYTFLNLTGLAVGMACCLLILLFVRDELRYDRFHEQAEHIYRVSMDVTFGSSTFPTWAPGPFGPAAIEEIPGVVDAVRLVPEKDVVASHEDLRFYEEGFFSADPSLFSVFDFPLLRGNPETVLAKPFTMVLSEAMAHKYFGDTDPIGQTLVVNGEHAYEITGVMQDVPRTSHLDLRFLASFETLQVLKEETINAWGPGDANTYLLLEEGYALEDLNEQTEALLGRHMEGWKIKAQYAPLLDLYLHSELDGTYERSGDPRYVILFSAIGLLILLIACINYMNLATAQALRRAQEIGVRKVMGASRLQLFRQFLSESMLLSLLALVGAVMLVELMLPGFNHLLQKDLALDYTGPLSVIPIFLGIALLVGLVAGGYPALFHASLNPTLVLKGAFRPGSTSNLVRKGLVVFQFAVTCALIMGTFVIQRQLDYVQQKRLGFQGEQVLVLSPPESVKAQYTSFKSEALQIAGVTHVTTAALPGFEFKSSVRPEGFAEDDNPIHFSIFRVDADFVGMMGIELVEGRDLSADLASDLRGAVLINEAAAQTFGWSDPLGKTIERLDDDFKWVTSEVVGVVKDFHNRSLRETISPKIIQLTEKHVNNILVRVHPDELPTTLAAIEAVWNGFAPAYPLSYTFLDDEFARFYRSEQLLGQLFGVFALLALFIACLGLIGLTAFTTEQRTKEIGVRKVLGASVQNIVVLLSKDFTRLVLIAFVVALPIAYLGMDQWLHDFAYHTDLSWWVFFAAGLLAMSIAFFTVSYQAIKAALADPVKSLRYE